MKMTRSWLKTAALPVTMSAALLVLQALLPILVRAEALTFHRVDTKKLYIQDSSRFFNISGDLVVFQSMGNKREGHHVHAYSIQKRQILRDKIKRVGSHHGKDSLQVLPDVWGKRMVYLAFSAAHPWWEVYVYDYETRVQRQITNVPAWYRSLPAISADRVVYTDTRGSSEEYGIYMYDLAREHETLLTMAPTLIKSLDIEGDRVIWADARKNPYALLYDVFLYDLATGIVQNMSNGPVTATAHSPSISGDLVVWADSRNNPRGHQGKTNIFLKNLATGETRQVTHGYDERSPSLSGDRLVYRDRSPDRDYDWILLNLRTGEQTGLLPKSSANTLMKIAGDHIVYVDTQTPGVRGAYFIATLPQ